MSGALTPEAIIAKLGMKPHPEGGHYVELWRDPPPEGGRGRASLIHFLLRAGEVSHWHAVDAPEIWIWQAGAPLELSIAETGQAGEVLRLGPDLMAGDRFQGVVPEGHWQAARSLGDWTLVSCVVAPAFRFEGFTLAPPGWRPELG